MSCNELGLSCSYIDCNAPANAPTHRLSYSLAFLVILTNHIKSGSSSIWKRSVVEPERPTREQLILGLYLSTVWGKCNNGYSNVYIQDCTPVRSTPVATPRRVASQRFRQGRQLYPFINNFSSSWNAEALLRKCGAGLYPQDHLQPCRK